MTSYDAVVLAGGAARRLGGADKPALPVGGRMLLDRVLAACAAAEGTVVVGPRRPTARQVRWTREQPAGGGPLPALAAGLAALGAEAGWPDAGRSGGVASDGQGRPEVVLLLAADLPFLTASTVNALADALTADREKRTEEEDGTEWEGVMLTDADGRDQPLAAAYRIEPLRRELALIGAEHGSLTGLPLRLLTGELALRRIADPTGEASFDCDTWEDVAVARARLDAASEG
jgi:molybdopterin-guanine dinucleotide biosynthesis protein A